ncbi:MAG: zf-HC2 domain-containing protein [Chloroflexi bacterium]|nr:zf-HC2 domain-containing protein [Chloroflexota bacterium]MBI2983465.1 zf-HC2 domain-containing protein [Chloroflexota bacterium]
MDCQECLERLHPYLDRELTSKELDEVRVHLDDCGGCDSAFVLERVFLDRLRGSATSDVAPSGVRERLILRLRTDVRRRS